MTELPGTSSKLSLDEELAPPSGGTSKQTRGSSLSSSDSGSLVKRIRAESESEKGVNRSLDSLLGSRSRPRTPAPYNSLNLLKDIKKKSKKSFLQPKPKKVECRCRETLFDSKTSKGSPGPGSYNLQLKHSPKAASFKSRHESPEEKEKRLYPGPAEYQVCQESTEGPKYSFSKRHETREFSGNKNTPSPLQYNTYPPAIGTHWNSKSKKIPFMGLAQRADNFVDYKRNTPGPGEYQMGGKMERGTTFPYAKRWPDPKPDSYIAPGPGTYELKTPGNQNHKRYQFGGKDSSLATIEESRSLSKILPPGPGKYKSEEIYAMKPKPLSMSNVGRKETEPDSVLGPGEYQMPGFAEEVSKSSKGYRMHSSDKGRFYSRTENPKVGPGAYEVRGSFDSQISSIRDLSLSTIHEAGSPELQKIRRRIRSPPIVKDVDRSASFISKEACNSPGPAHYNIQRSFDGSTKGVSMAWRHPQASFGNERGVSPGPIYKTEYGSTFSSKQGLLKAATMKGRHPTKDYVNSPGPGAYQVN